jgi:hypothetical protein
MSPQGQPERFSAPAACEHQKSGEGSDRFIAPRSASRAQSSVLLAGFIEHRLVVPYGRLEQLLQLRGRQEFWLLARSRQRLHRVRDVVRAEARQSSLPPGTR